ncbi:MAG: hypothetical protein ACO3Q1_01480 [Candidatus Nanopelagicales bacterium]
MRLVKNPGIPIAWVTPTQIQVGIDTRNSICVEGISSLARTVLQEANGIKKFSKIEVNAVANLVSHKILLEGSPELSRKNSISSFKLEISEELDYQESFTSVFKLFGFERAVQRSSDPRYSKADFSIVSGFASLILQQGHISVNFVGDSILLGPLVVPGETSCLNCLFLHRKDLNCLWPAISLSFDHAVRRTNPNLLKLAAGFSVQILDNYISKSGFDLRNQMLEINLKDFFMELRELSFHPKCGCCE